jgi:hypothetical protein
MKMRRVSRPSSFAAFMDGLTRFPDSTDMGICVFAPALGIGHDSNKGRFGISTDDDVFPEITNVFSDER